MRDTLAVQGDIDALRDQIAKLENEKRSAPVAEKFAQFRRSRRGEWYGPYWQDSFKRWYEFSHIVYEYSWSAHMIYDVEKGEVVQICSDLSLPVESADVLAEVCRQIIENPRPQ